jgi:polysaccharide pyruvyl transferase WcaK-like protein
VRVFVTGLCLQGNKGGPAIALSLMDAVRKEMPDVEFVLAVPPAPQFEFEKRWAALYGVTVVEDLWSIGLWSLNPLQILRDGLGTTYRRTKQIAKWYAALRSCDLVLDMTAISYVGPPEGSEAHALGTRYRYFKAARLVGRKFFAWTQSYGPFSTPAIAAASRAASWFRSSFRVRRARSIPTWPSCSTTICSAARRWSTAISRRCQIAR